MMSHLLCHMLLLVFLTGRDVMLVKASDNEVRCGYDNCCQAMAKLMTVVEKINKKQDEQAAYMHEIHRKQAKDLEELKVKLDRSLTSTDAFSTQLQKHSADLLIHDERLKAHDASQTDLCQNLKCSQSTQRKPKDCSEIREGGHNASGVYRVYPGSDNTSIEVDVYCDFSSVGQSWLVFQRRTNRSVSFDRNWTDYANGFGDLTGEFWLGNEKLALLTMNKKYKLRIEMDNGYTMWAEYTTFSVKPASDKYRLTVAGFSGNAGDGFAYHNNMMFSTKDEGNDLHAGYCAKEYTGGWWFNYCAYCNLNGLYIGDSLAYADRGIYWIKWNLSYVSTKFTEMKIAAVQ